MRAEWWVRPRSSLGKQASWLSCVLEGSQRWSAFLWPPCSSSLCRGVPLQRGNHRHRRPNPRCSVHRPRRPRGGWHCWLLLWKPLHPRCHHFPVFVGDPGRHQLGSLSAQGHLGAFLLEGEFSLTVIVRSRGWGDRGCQTSFAEAWFPLESSDHSPKKCDTGLATTCSQNPVS